MIELLFGNCLYKVTIEFGAPLFKDICLVLKFWLRCSHEKLTIMLLKLVP